MSATIVRVMFRNHSLLIAAALALCLGLAACSRTETPAPAEDGAAARAETLIQERDALLGRKASLEAVPAKWSLDDDIRSTLTGYYEGDALRIIEEEMTMGEFGSARSSYFYTPKGGLFAYTESKASQRGARTGKAVTEQIDLELLFAPNGSLAGGERKVDGSPAELTGVEAQGVKMHARELELVLRERRGGAGQ